MTPVGRFAPSPTHHLHLGSLCTALASFCHIKSINGRWLLRIEDVDFERCKQTYSDSILYDLEKLGLHWDLEVVYQSNRIDIYNEYLYKQLAPLSYACHCSRKQLQAYQQTNPEPHALNTPAVYPRFCLHKHLDYRHSKSKIRLQLPNVYTAFLDGVQGVVWDNPAESLGDVVIKRQNQMINYLLACTIDDGLQGITHVMRGLDILPLTVAQLKILQICQLPTPSYFYHLPLLHNQDGQKLSKQNLATPIDTKNPSLLLFTALSLLGQPVDDAMKNARVEDIIAYAIKNWDNSPLIGKKSLNKII